MQFQKLLSAFTCAVLATVSFAADAQDLPVIQRSQLIPFPTGVTPHPSGEKYSFGCDLALDGNRMLVSAARAIEAAPAQVFFYRRNTAGSWSYAGRINPPQGATFDCEVALQGATAAVSGHINGKEAVFVLRNTTGSTWISTQVIEKKGNSVSLGPNFLAFGNETTNNNRGLLRIYAQVEPGKYTPAVDFSGPDPASGFGGNVIAGVSTVVVTQGDDLGNNQKVFVYARYRDVWSLQKTYNLGFRVLDDVAYDSNNLAIQRSDFDMTEFHRRTNGVWAPTQTIPGDDTEFQGYVSGPIAISSSHFIYRVSGTNEIRLAEMRDGLYRDAAILNAQYGSWPIISSNTAVISYPYGGPSNATFSGAVEIFSLPAVTN